MTFIDTLRAATTQNQSMLCVGLDPDPPVSPSTWAIPARFTTFACIVDTTADLVYSLQATSCLLCPLLGRTSSNA